MSCAYSFTRRSAKLAQRNTAVQNSAICHMRLPMEIGKIKGVYLSDGSWRSNSARCANWKHNTITARLRRYIMFSPVLPANTTRLRTEDNSSLAVWLLLVREVQPGLRGMCFYCAPIAASCSVRLSTTLKPPGKHLEHCSRRHQAPCRLKHLSNTRKVS